MRKGLGLGRVQKDVSLWVHAVLPALALLPCQYPIIMFPAEPSCFKTFHFHKVINRRVSLSVNK